MKELIQDLIEKSGLSNNEFAELVGTSASYLSQQKHFKHINITKLRDWMQLVGVFEIESYTKHGRIEITIKEK